MLKSRKQWTNLMRPGQYPTIEEVSWRRSTLFKPELQRRLIELLKPRLFPTAYKRLNEEIRADLKAVPAHAFIGVREDLKSFLDHARNIVQRGHPDINAAERSPWLFIFSGSGYEREAAANAFLRSVPEANLKCYRSATS